MYRPPGSEGRKSQPLSASPATFLGFVPSQAAASTVGRGQGPLLFPADTMKQVLHTTVQGGGRGGTWRAASQARSREDPPARQPPSRRRPPPPGPNAWWQEAPSRRASCTNCLLRSKGLSAGRLACRSSQFLPHPACSYREQLCAEQAP